MTGVQTCALPILWDVQTIKNITGLSDYYFTADKLEAYKDANYLKGGIVFADAVTTVSNTYAEEIKTPFYGEKLDGLMCARANSLRGIVNGIDYNEFNPETDPYITKTYNATTFRKEKVKNKLQLQRDLGLQEDPKTMMVGIVSRLTDQKGFDLIAYVMDELCQDAIQLEFLEPVMNVMRICSVTLTGNIMERYLLRSIMMRKCLTVSMHQQMRS